MRIADLGLGSNAARITSVRSLPRAGSGEKGGEEISRSLAVDSEDMSPEDKDALDGDHITLELGFAYRAEPSGDSAQSKARNIQYVSIHTATVSLTGLFVIVYWWSSLLACEGFSVSNSVSVTTHRRRAGMLICRLQLFGLR